MKGRLAALLLCAAGPFGTAEIEFDVVPALVTEPLEPVAGTPLVIVLAPDLIAPGRALRLRDADRDRVFAERQLAGRAIDRYRFELPVELEALVVELHRADEVLLRWPASGAEPVWPQPVADTGAPPPYGPDGEADCPDLPPADDDGRDALLAWLASCPLDNAPLAERNLRGVNLAGRDLRRADLRGSDLSDADLAGASLVGASLLGARLDGADLSGADLEVADLGHASLFVTDLGSASLRGADLRRALLTDANLANADLTGARLTETNLDAADLTGAVCPDGERAGRRCDDHLTLP